MEFFRSKDEPDQLWRLDPEFPKGSDGPRFKIFFVSEEYLFLLDQDRFNDIPDYGITGSTRVSGKGVVIDAFAQNPSFDAAKIASCSLLQQ